MAVPFRMKGLGVNFLREVQLGELTDSKRKSGIQPLGGQDPPAMSLVT